MSEKKYDHAEAFCLMQYECQTCRTIETLWNSRDGVTPFIIACKTLCGGEMHHLNFGADLCVPDFYPEPGRRVFIDFPDHFREVFKKRQIRNQWDAKNHPMKERWKTRAEALGALMEDDTPDGTPYVLQL